MAVNPIIPPTLLQKLPYPSFIITTMLEYKEMLVAIFCFIFLLHWRRNRNSLFTDWPILRMLPSLLYNLPNIHDHVTQTLKKNGGTGQFIAPWFTQSSAVLTCDAMNVLHITSTNFRNYDKGPEFREIFEVLGNGVLTDSKEWKYSRELLHSLFKKRNFHMFLDKIVQKKVESCLFPFLDHVEKKRMEVDLQDVFNRFTFDNICCMVLGFDPNCLSIDLPLVVYEKFFGEAQVALFYRMVVPRSLWKLQKWLGIGKERKMSEARKVSELLFNEFIRCKRKQQDKSGDGVEEADFELLSEIMMMEEEKKGQMDDKLIRDNVLNILSAGKDTLTAGLSWFFWLVAAHPSVEAKILEELKENFPTKEEKRMVLGKKEVEKLVYLHATICEAMRLFPPIPFALRHAIKSDILPSGHHVNPDTLIIYSLYTMGRSEEIWGKDCLEFKPERWISEKGGIIHVPSYKYITFNAGPRTCLGKEMSFVEMKMVASAILWNYHVQVVEGHPVYPSLSIGLFMKHGLEVRITKRQRETVEGRKSILGYVQQ